MSRRIVVTGGAGFIGRSVVRQLAARGDTVVALVRDPGNGAFLASPNVELIASDLGDVAALTELLRGADAVVHGAGSYRIGIPAKERPAMWDANVGVTERVMSAARAAGTPRIAYVSTVNVFGDTHGRVVDETYRRDLGEGFLSWYDETKFRAHERVEAEIATGAPVVILQPGQVYGPSDHSAVGRLLADAYAGRLRYLALTGLGLGMAHVDDTAGGIVTALDSGRNGEAYVLAGELSTLKDCLALAARLGGRRLSRLTLPTGLLRAMALVSDRVGGLPGLPASLAETISASSVSYFASHNKAAREFGYAPRSLEQGLRDTFSVHS